MKVKLISDGTSIGTKIMTENGDIIENVSLVNFYLCTNEIQATLELVIDGVEAELAAEATMINDDLEAEEIAVGGSV